MKILGLIDKKNLIPWLDNISKEYETFLPIQDIENARIDFMEYNYFLKKRASSSKSKDSLRPNFSEKTRLSPKMVFSPKTEKIFDFEYAKDTEDPENVDTTLIISEARSTVGPKVIFGIKPCDIAGLKRLDLFYGEGQNKDTYYLDKRKDSILISIGCNNPFPDCFCTSVDGNPFDFENTDIGLVEIDKGYAIVKSTEKAKKLLSGSKKFISNNFIAEDDAITVDGIIKDSEERIKRYWKEIKKKNYQK